MSLHSAANPHAPNSLFLKLESRLVFDAAIGASIVAASDDGTEASRTVLAADGIEESFDGAPSGFQSDALQVVFIDSAVALNDALLAAIAPGAVVVNLEASRDGVTQISEWLHAHGNVAGVHIISHGSEGTIHLGNAELSVETLGRYSDQLVGWRDALTLDADVLVYGCDVAANGNDALLNSLALYTGADVAASINATGSAALGGDWELEQKTGEIQVAGIVADGYEGLLATGGPTPTLTPAQTTLNAGQTIQITLDVDSGTTANTSIGSGWGLSAAEITASAGTISNLQYSGANGIYTFDYTAASIGGSVTISIAADAYKTGSGPTASPGNQATSLSLTVVADSTAPTISSLAIPSGGADSTFVAGNTVDVTVSFDESVNVVTTGGTPYITLNVGGVSKTASYLSGTGTSTLTFRYTVAAGDTDTDGISIGANSLTLNGGTIKDGAGNAATTTFAAVAAASAAKVDTTAPTATIAFADTALKAGETSLVTITFSEAVTGFADADVTAPNGTLSTFSSADGGVTWAATYTPNTDVEDATNQIALGTTYTDAGGNAGTAANSANFAIDTKLPTVSVTDNVAGTVNAATSSITYTYTFSEAVSGLTAGDFVVTDGAISSVSGSGTAWTVVVTPAPGVASGNIKLELNENAVVDAAGNGNAYSQQEIQALDTVAPSAPAVSSQITTDTTPLITGTATVGSGETLTVTVAGVTYTEGDGNLTRTGSNWALQIPSTHLVGGVSEPYTLLPGTYSVTAHVTDAALNAASDATTEELVVQFSFGGATVYFDTVYKGYFQGDGTSLPTLEANNILIAEQLTTQAGSKFLFTSLSTATTFSGNNVLGSLVYTDASGTEHVISGEMSRIFKSGSTLEGFYFYVNNGTASTADDAAYVIVVPGQEGEFGLASVESTSSDLVDAKLNSLLTSQPPLMSVADVSVNESAGTATVTVTLSKVYGSAITVDYATSDGTAVSGSDYTAKTGSLTFAAGETAKTFTVAITNDAIYEPTQQFGVTLSNALAGAVPVLLADATANVSILDDDPIPTVSVNNVTASESSPWVVFTVSLSNASASAVSFTPVLSDSGATATLAGSGADVGSTLQYYDATLGWTTVSGPLTIAAGQTSVLVRVAVNSDNVFEQSETFKLSTGAITGTVTNSGPAIGTGTIKDDGSSTNVFLGAATSGTATAGTADDDRPAVTLLGAEETSPGVFETAGSSYREDAGYAVFTVELGNPSQFDTVLDFALASGTALHEGGISALRRFRGPRILRFQPMAA